MDRPVSSGVSRNVKVLLVILAVALVFIVFAVVNAFIGIREISVEGQVLCTEAEILSASGIEIGKGYFSYNSSKAEAKVKELLPCVERIHISRSFLGRVTVSVEETKGYWYVESYGEYFALSKELVVIKSDEVRDSFIKCGLVRLDFPEVKSLVFGKAIEIYDDGRDVNYVTELLDDIMETDLYANDRVDRVEIKNKFNVYVVVDLKYNVFLGNCTDVDKKTLNITNVIQSGRLDGDGRWEVDVSDLGNIVTRKNDDLDFSFLIPMYGG